MFFKKFDYRFPNTYFTERLSVAASKIHKFLTSFMKLVTEMKLLLDFGSLYFAATGPLLRPRPWPWPPALALNLYLPAPPWTPILYLPALAPNLFLTTLPTCSNSIELTSGMYKLDNKDTRATSFDIFLVSFLLTLNRFYTWF